MATKPQSMADIDKIIQEQNEQWQNTINKIKPNQRGNFLADVQSGKVTTIPGTNIKVRYKEGNKVNLPNGGSTGEAGGYYVTTPDGQEKLVWSGGGSKNYILSAMITAGLGLAEGIGFTDSAETQRRQVANYYGVKYVSWIESEKKSTVTDETMAEDKGFGVFINAGGKPVGAESEQQKKDFQELGFKEITGDNNAIQEAIKNPVPPSKAQPPATATTSLTETTPTINFKDGLSDAQKKGINDLVKKPVTDWSSTDIANWNYATNNQALPVQGTVTGNKGIYKGKEGLNLNANAVNELFSQYQGRDATKQELDYWSNKKVGDLEDTLAKTSFFDKPIADKIREQMMMQGKTYISNQAELETLAKSGGLSEEDITRIGGQTGMLFAPTETINKITNIGTTGATNTTDTTNETGTTNATGTTGATGSTGNAEDDLADFTADILGDPNASDTEILDALNKIKEGQIDPYYKQIISQAQNDVVTAINRQYEDRIRQLQTESYNLAENIASTQKTLESRGMTFSGEAIKQLGTLSAFAAPRPESVTPTQLGQAGQPLTMTPEQMGLEGDVNMQNRLFAEGSRSNFNRTLEDIGKEALRTLGTTGVAGLGLPEQASGTTPTTGTLEYDYANQLQNTYQNLQSQKDTLNQYQETFL